MVFLSVLICGMIGYGLGIGAININMLKDISNNEHCNNSSLADTLACLNNDFISWYEFNLSNTRNELSEEQFIEQGGVCTHATNWYDKRLKERGFNTKIITLLPREGLLEEYGHQFLIAYDDKVDIYCIVDQVTYKCTRLSQ
jgi:hypothetical protein